MSKATSNSTTQSVLPPADLTATIDRLRTIAAEAGDHLLLGDGEPQPDHKLLDLCAEALHWRRRSDEAERAWRANDDAKFASCHTEGRHFTSLEQADSLADFRFVLGLEKSMKRILFEAKKIRATTAAGIYAKALIVRSTKTGAALMAMSLADDLIACPGIRESLWSTKAGA